MKANNLIKSLGPGLLWAGAAIGVSHLVQSTRAGATYGFQLVFIILLVNLFKYPFFEYGPRYASSTGESLLHGYKRLGTPILILYLILTLATMFTLQAAITVVTAGLFSYIFPNLFNISIWSFLILGVASIIVIFGKYSFLDRIIKFIIVLLALSTIIAVIAAFSKGFNPTPEYTKDFHWNFSDITLLIAFAGWMPSAIDISVWHSFWAVAKQKQGKHIPTVKESLFDFNVGYIGTAVLSLGFLSLGALIMYGSGGTFSSNGTTFAGQLIDLFTKSLGEWAFVFIAIAALATMSSTTLTCLDAYPRVLKPATELLIPQLKSNDDNWNWLSWLWLSILLSGTIIIIIFFLKGMSFLVDLATTLSFLTAPILGYLNFKVVRGKNVPKHYQPKTWLILLSWVGLIILSCFSIYYILWKFFI